MIDMQVGPLGGILLWVLVALVLIGFIAAPTLGGAVVWMIGMAAVLLVVFFVLRRLYLRAAGRRGGRS